MSRPNGQLYSLEWQQSWPFMIVKVWNLDSSFFKVDALHFSEPLFSRNISFPMFKLFCYIWSKLLVTLEMRNFLSFFVLISPDLCQLSLRQHWLSSHDHGHWPWGMCILDVRYLLTMFLNISVSLLFQELDPFLFECFSILHTNLFRRRIDKHHFLFHLLPYFSNKLEHRSTPQWMKRVNDWRSDKCCETATTRPSPLCHQYLQHNTTIWHLPRKVRYFLVPFVGHSVLRLQSSFYPETDTPQLFLSSFFSRIIQR